MKVKELTPKEVVYHLDNYIVGQKDAKKAIAISLRNRYRRLQLEGEMQEEVTPKNIMMIGPTGVGKTEIARRLAKIVNAPFIKVEATKFTEVGYVGRDVESMVRDLVENAALIIKAEKREFVYEEAKERAIKRLAALMRPGIKKAKRNSEMAAFQNMLKGMGIPDSDLGMEEIEEVTEAISTERTVLEQQLRDGKFMNHEVTIKVNEKKLSGLGSQNEQMMMIQDALSQMTPKQKVVRTVTVEEAIEILADEEVDNLVNSEDISQEALKLTENSGIIFIDEIDKITSKSNQSGEVSREGVQRDILPIVEGSQVTTKYGVIETDHILFIASGAFQIAKPSDLIPELQGRFPIRVELNDLSKDDFVRILTEPKNSLITQYHALLATDGVTVTFNQEAIERMAEIAMKLNRDTDNIGARRLHTILEKLFEDLLFEGPDMSGTQVEITRNYVDEKLNSIIEDKDLNYYIL